MLHRETLFLDVYCFIYSKNIVFKQVYLILKVSQKNLYQPGFFLTMEVPSWFEVHHPIEISKFSYRHDFFIPWTKLNEIQAFLPMARSVLRRFLRKVPSKDETGIQGRTLFPSAAAKIMCSYGPLRFIYVICIRAGQSREELARDIHL